MSQDSKEQQERSNIRISTQWQWKVASWKTSAPREKNQVLVEACSERVCLVPGVLVVH